MARWWKLLWAGKKEEEATKEAINGALRRLDATTRAIRIDHELDRLVADIEEVQAQGEAAMAGKGLSDERKVQGEQS